jgi:hypothetical protein
VKGYQKLSKAYRFVGPWFLRLISPLAPFSTVTGRLLELNATIFVLDIAIDGSSNGCRAGI